MQYKVKINSAPEAALFSAQCCNFAEEIDVKKGRNIVDAKSLMGVLAMGLGELVEVIFHSDDLEACDKYFNTIKMWIVEE